MRTSVAGQNIVHRSRTVRPLKVRGSQCIFFWREIIMKTAWLLLFFAGVTEVTWAIAMKYSEGFTRVAPSVLTAVFYIASAVLLSIALHKLPLGTAYAIWTGMGIVGTTVLGLLLFHETLTPAHVVCLLMIVGGIAGLKMLA